MKNYKDIYESFELQLKSISCANHSWEMTNGEFLHFHTPIQITYKDEPYTIKYAFYDRGNEEVIVGSEAWEMYWHQLSEESQKQILDEYDMEFHGETNPLILEEVNDLVFHQMSWVVGDKEYAHEIADNIAQAVMEDIQESADSNFSDTDVRLAIGRVLVRLTGIGA